MDDMSSDTQNADTPGADGGRSVLSAAYDRVSARFQEQIRARGAALCPEAARGDAVYAALLRAWEDTICVARRDRLTGFGNRVLMDEIAEEVGVCATGAFAVVAVGLERVQEINDLFGHDAGDHVLATSAHRMAAHLTEGRDYGFRADGGAFVLLIESVDTEEARRTLCDQIVASLKAPIAYANLELRVGAAAGLAVAGDGETAFATVRRSVRALRQAKVAGEAVMLSAGQGEVEDRTQLADDFRRGLARGEIFVALQPQVEATSWELSGCEVLARWAHPTFGTIHPNTFLPIAEELGLTKDLDQCVLKQAIAMRARLADAGLTVPCLSVNVSAERLFSADLVAELSGLEGLANGGLAFEVQESAILGMDREEKLDQIWMLKALGIEFEVDDFGTGRSTLADVLALQPDRLKIDRRFVTGIDGSAWKRKHAASLIQMARSVGATTIFEGVETLAEADTLREMGAGSLQGFIFGRPMSVDMMIERERAARPVDKSDTGRGP